MYPNTNSNSNKQRFVVAVRKEYPGTRIPGPEYYYSDNQTTDLYPYPGTYGPGAHRYPGTRVPVPRGCAKSRTWGFGCAHISTCAHIVHTMCAHPTLGVKGHVRIVRAN
eukprot:3453020-Rhodomonas_salina.1